MKTRNSVTKGYGFFDQIACNDFKGWALRWWELCGDYATYPHMLYGSDGCARCNVKITPGHMCADVAEYMKTDEFKRETTD